MLEKINKQKLVMIGNGMAGVRTVEELLKRAPDLYDITVFGAEPHGNYNRILLSPVLAGEKTVDEIVLNTEHWYDDNNITLRKGETVVDDRPAHLRGRHRRGRRAFAYDRLLIAHRLQSVHPAGSGQGPAGRDRLSRHRRHQQHDRGLASHRKHAVVIGGGLLGLEAANGLMQRGMNVTVVHLLDWLMERQLDESPAACCASRWKNAAWCS